MNEKIVLTLDSKKPISNIGKALSSETRITILEILQDESLNVNEIAEKLNLPVSTAAANIKVLEDAGLIITNYQPGVRGSMKLCGKRVNEILICLDTDESDAARFPRQEMPVGSYSNCSAEPTCGLASESGIITQNSPNGFFLPQRIDAQLLWLSRGFVEYKFSNNLAQGQRIKKIELSMEVCSEAPRYRMIWPSDITIWINDFEIGTWTSPGDFGDRKGILNPSWWPSYNTQYGVLKTWKITDQETMLDGEHFSMVTLMEIPNLSREYISVRIGVKEDAKNQGGFNLFGKQFGDYNQSILMQIEYI